jgi:hypothetical protein
VSRIIVLDSDLRKKLPRGKLKEKTKRIFRDLRRAGKPVTWKVARLFAVNHLERWS